MDGLYAEARAKKKVTMKDNLIKFGLVAGMVVFFGLGFITFNVVLIIVGIAFLGLGYYFLPRLATEYEYVFCDGQVDFDKINGGVKRKTVLRVDFEKLVVIAPKASHALDGYRHNGVEVKDFTSGEDQGKVYGMVVNGNEKNLMILFEPSEKMLAAMKQKAPRKVMEY